MQREDPLGGSTTLPHACGGSSALKKFSELATLALCLLLESYIMLISPNMNETSVHGCSGYLHCSCSGEAGCAHACRFWPNHGVECRWFVLSTVFTIIMASRNIV